MKNTAANVSRNGKINAIKFAASHRLPLKTTPANAAHRGGKPTAMKHQTSHPRRLTDREQRHQFGAAIAGEISGIKPFREQSPQNRDHQNETRSKIQQPNVT